MILDPKQDVYQPTKYNNIISKMVWFITFDIVAAQYGTSNDCV